MADDWYHIAHTPDGIHVHLMNAFQLATVAQQAMDINPELSERDAVAIAVDHYATLIRADLGYPPDHPFAPGWVSVLSPGMPHPSLMAQATYHEELPEALRG